MSRKPENQFISGVHQYLPPRVDPYRAKVKNPYVAGIWDWWYSGTKTDLWVEYKFLRAFPKRDTTMILPDLSELQLQWGRNRYQEGRNLVVILGFPEGGVVLDDRLWEKSLPSSWYRKALCSRLSLAVWIRSYTMKE